MQLIRTILAILSSVLLTSCVVFPLDEKDPDPGLYWCPPLHNCVSTEAVTFVHHIAPFTLAMPLEEAWPLIREAVEALPGTHIYSEHQGYIYAHSYTRIFHFLDFFEVLAVPEKNQLNVRSSSLIALTDLFMNYSRTQKFRHLLEEKGVIVAQ